MSPPSKLPHFLYFRFGGRALGSRVALFNSLGKDGWKDERVGPTQFKKLHEQSRKAWASGEDAPMISANLPQLTLPNGVLVTQSTAIARWAAQQESDEAKQQPHFVPDLYPQNADEAILVDETMAIVDQIVAMTPKDSDIEVRKEKRLAYSTTGFMHVGMSIIEKRLEASGGPFLLGDRLTLADLYIKTPLADLILDKQF